MAAFLSSRSVGRIGDDAVPIGLLQCSPHPRDTIHLLISQLVSGTREFGTQQARIVFRILDNQYSHMGARRIANASARAATVSVSAVPGKTLGIGGWNEFKRRDHAAGPAASPQHAGELMRRQRPAEVVSLNLGALML